MYYTIGVRDVVGQLVMFPNNGNHLPPHVRNTIIRKMYTCTDKYLYKSSIRGINYKMKPGYKSLWTYDCGFGDRVVIYFQL